jgi:hypothetical protein
MDWINGISLTCFVSSYVISLLLEISRLFFQARIRIMVIWGFGAAGLAAQSLYLVAQARSALSVGARVPWSSWRDFCLLAAWVLAGAYLALSLRKPHNALGIFLLPLVLGLIGLAAAWRGAGFPAGQALNIWRVIHGSALLLGTTAVLLGFATGTMYLVQSYRLQHKLPPRQGFRLPTLEWLQRFNREALLISTALLAVGLLSGVVLNLGRRAGPDAGGVEWTDPVVLSSSVLFAWLLAITVFETFYRPARQGRKVAYLTLASFLFLLLALGFVLWGDHAARESLQSVAAYRASSWRSARLHGEALR